MKELSVAAALENVYAAFASVPRPKKIEGCPCCTTPERLAVLTAGPLRSLDEELLSWYGFKSMTTIGDEQDYLYFIPRLLESLDWGFSSPDPEMTFCKIRSCKLNESQWDAVSQYLYAHWQAKLRSSESAENELRNILVAARKFGEPWQGFLQEWESKKSLEATAQLAAFIIENAYNLDSARKFSAYMEENDDAEVKTLKAWLLSSHGRQRLEQDFFADPDGALAQKISDALSCVEWLASS